MAGGFMEVQLLDQVLRLLWSARSEILLFSLAFLLHHFLFGNVLPKSDSKTDKDQKLRNRKDADRDTRDFREEDDQASSAMRDPAQALSCSRSAFDRGDHRTVLRCWNQLKRTDQVPADHLAQIVESMKRFKKDSAGIIQDVRIYLKRATPEHGGIFFVNQVLEPLAKSLDAELITGILASLPSVGLVADQKTYEIVLSMHFATRSFREVVSTSQTMKAAGIEPTDKSRLVLLKTALHVGNFEDALRLHRAVLKTAATQFPTVSSAPRHMAMQLVELACRERRVDTVIQELETFSAMPMTTEMLNAILAESMRCRNLDFAARTEVLAIQRDVERNGRTYDLLVRSAGNQMEKVAKFLDEMLARGVECGEDVANAVLAACATDKNLNPEVVEKLYTLLQSQKSVQNAPMLALVRFFGENGKPERSCEIFDKHLVGQAGLSNGVKRRALIDARTERCLVNAALACQREDIAAQILEPTPADTAKHISMIRGCAQKGDLEGAAGVFRALEASGAELTHSLYNTMLDACVECNSIDKAEALMKRMQDANMTDAVSFNTILKAQLKRENYTKARAVIESMRKVGHQPNEVTYNELINSLVQSSKPAVRSKVWEVLDEMKADGVTPNRITCSIILRSLKATSSDADITRTMELTDSMGEPMDEVLLSSVVEACVRIGKPALLTSKLEQFVGKGGMPVTGVHTFGSLIKAFGRSKDMAGAWRCWKEMRSQHVKPTSITIGCMVEAIVSNGDVDGGYELISQLLEDDHCHDQINSIIYGSVLKGYGRTHRFDRMLTVFKEMTANGVQPSVATFNAVMDACARNNRMHLAPQLMADLRDRGLTPNLITFSTMIKGFCQKGDVPAALAALDDLHQNKSLRPDEIVYNTLLEGCSKAGLVLEGERVLAEMQEMGVAPSNYTLTVVVKLLSQARKVQRAFDIVEELTTKYRFKPNAECYCSLLQACISSHSFQKGFTLFEQMVKDRYLVDTRALQSLVRGLLSSTSFQAAVSVVRCSLGLQGFQGKPAVHYRVSSGSLGDIFVGEVLTALVSARGQDAGHATEMAQDLLKDIQEQGRIRIDAAVERRVQAKR